MIAVVTVLAGFVASRSFHRDSQIESALQTLPQQTLIANFTDWAAIRDELDPGLSSRSPEEARAAVFAKAYSRDYFRTTSLLGVFDRDMASTYGWTVDHKSGRCTARVGDGAVEVLRMPDGFDFSTADRALTKLGYAEPDDHGVRVADDQTLAGIAGGLTPQLTAVAVLPDEHLVVTSDAAAYAVWPWTRSRMTRARC